VLAVVVPGERVGVDLLYGALAGAVNVGGLALLYDGLARHTAAVVAPVAAVVGAGVPVAWGFLHGEHPSPVVVAGIALAIAAGGLIAAEPLGGASIRVAQGTAQAVFAGVGLGSSLVLFSETSHRSGQWPVAAARVAALLAVGLAVVVLRARRQVPLPRGRDRSLAASAGVLDVGATALLVVAVRRELLVVVAPIAALAPAFTVLLAWAIDRERLRRAQGVGVALALTALALISRG
jgi:drug/metabolite transporter (DMT)-like permease